MCRYCSLAVSNLLSHYVVTDSERDRFRDSKLFLDTPFLDAADASTGTLG